LSAAMGRLLEVYNRTMRILFTLDKYSSREGGADQVARGVVDCLLQAGHEVRVLEPGPEHEANGGAFSLVRRPLPWPGLIRDSDLTTLRWNLFWSDVIDHELASFPPHMILTQNRLAPSAVAAAKRAGIRSCIMFHGYRPLSPTFFFGQDALTCDPPGFWNLPLRYKLKWPLVKRMLQLYHAAYAAADIVIANSNYTARVIERFFGRKAALLYPVIDLGPSRLGPGMDKPPRPEAPILFVKPQRIKGIHKLVAVSRIMPEHSFVVVCTPSRRLRGELAQRDNVTLRGWVDEMDEVYRNTSLLFAPAMIPEPFGRVFVEAGLRGIPAVASNAGGIPEAVGEGGILLNMHVSAEQWRDAIVEALAPTALAHLRPAARLHASELVNSHKCDALLNALGLGG